MGGKRLDGKGTSNAITLRDKPVNLVIRKAEAADLEQIEKLWIQLIDYVHGLDERHGEGT